MAESNWPIIQSCIVGVVGIAGMILNHYTSRHSLAVNARVNRDLKELDFKQAHAKLLIQKRFDAYQSLENMCFELMTSKAVGGTSILTVMIEEEDFEAFFQRFDKFAVIHCQWLPEGGSVTRFDHLYKLLCQYNESIPKDDTSGRISISMRDGPEIKEAAHALINSLQHEYLNLHQNTFQMLAKNERPQA